MHITFSPARAALLFLVALTLLLALPLRAGTAHPDATRPNVVVVMMDDLDTSVWQTALDRRYLPNIQRHVIDRGTTFEQTFVSLSWCCPSRAAPT